MPIIIAALGLLAAVYFFVMRAKNAADMAGDLADVANDVRLAARRFGFRRKGNQHPVESIEDLPLAIGSTASAFLELDDLPTREQRDMLAIQLRSVLRLSAEDAEEIMVLGHWFVSQCGSPDQAITRLATKTWRLGGHDALAPLETIVGKMITVNGTTPSRKQQDALDDIRHILRAR